MLSPRPVKEITFLVIIVCRWKSKKKNLIAKLSSLKKIKSLTLLTLGKKKKKNTFPLVNCNTQGCSWASENSIACHCHNTRNIALQPKNIVQVLEMCEKKKCPTVVYSSQVPPAALICRGPAWDFCTWDHFYLTVIVVVCWNKNSSRS